jgi:hypothetical protein
MDICYVDCDPLSRLQPIDNTQDAAEADGLIAPRQKKKTPDVERFELERLAPPRPVKCPDLSKLNL